ncbi:hypothetical protein QA584_04165 [Anaerocolumna sp. AGMB13025]|uniref:hypothetical protein n=1 Tax=Anaerocolumna sp. AGMB13025 TaxID=3039116 RepID=UPI00241C32CB|nr:hypothetical protein [Anaerocolumna sp. AGMB13025]WFR58270.1 hypothetical protein QA584_04165 [Anaerocolumna sp. AGMB13025]
MIIEKICIVKRRDRILASLLSGLIIIVVLAVFVCTFIFKDTIDSDTRVSLFFIFRLILGIIGTASVFDLISLFNQNSSVGLRIVSFFASRRKTQKYLVLSPDRNQIQQNLCEGIYGKQDINSFVYIYGFPNRGKTTAAFFLLEGVFLNRVKDVTQFKNIVFINCANKKDDIFSFFKSTDSTSRLREFENSLIVLDNVEQLGQRFIEINNELFSSANNMFVLIEDSDNGRPFVDFQLLQAAKVFDFNNSLIDTISQDDIHPLIKHLSPKDKEIFFAIYFTILSNTFVEIDFICKILNVKRKEISKCLKYIRKANIFLPFPFNTNYIYCICEQSLLMEIEKFYVYDDEYNKILDIFVQSKYVEEEIRWICFVKSNPNAIKQVDEKIRLKLFSEALMNGRYKPLYQSLERAIFLQPEKKQLFIYECGILNFHMGNHKISAEMFQKMLENMKGNKSKEAILHIIESSHGSSNSRVMNNILKYIVDMKKEETLYSLYATYWEIHIATEKGIFNYSDLKKIRKDLQHYSTVENVHLHNEIIKRCYTDEIRCYHILGIELPESLIKNFISFLRDQGEALYDYYYNLYIKASSIHYIEIPNCSQEESDTIALELIGKAKEYYRRANDSLSSDEKSRRASLVKQSELDMISVGCDVGPILCQIDEFLMHSQANNVDVHEAFCHTLLAKIKIADGRNISNQYGINLSSHTMDEVKKHFDTAKEIYSKYHNRYGIFRINFLELLFKLYQFPVDQLRLLTELKQLISDNPEYIKEKKIVDRIEERKKTNQGMTMLLYWILRSYPIILQ